MYICILSVLAVAMYMYVCLLFYCIRVLLLAHLLNGMYV